MKGALLALPQDRVTLRFLLTGTGPVTSGDVQLANASQALIINFNMEVPEAVQGQAKGLGLPPRRTPPPRPPPRQPPTPPTHPPINSIKIHGINLQDAFWSNSGIRVASADTPGLAGA